MQPLSQKLVSSLALLILIQPAVLIAQSAEDDAFFESKIRPILVKRCYSCHGPAKQESGLRLDSRSALLAGGDSGVVIIQGKPEESLLIKAISPLDDSLKMPPKQPLSKEQIQLLTQWVSKGAPWPKPHVAKSADISHWAFQPISKPQLPELTGTNTHPIDLFIDAKLQQFSIASLPPTSPVDLIRRATVDLTGLPPKWSDIETFTSDPSEEAYTALIERLLDSPRYGERWGRHWLDLARYSDTQGGSVDCPIPSAYLYRDYVIDAFNKDKPYNQFIVEQIAGDLLAATHPSENSNEQIIATGFIALSLRNGIFKHYHPELIIEDTIDTIGRAILGVTIRCARCHDHKTDPFPTEDYYRLYGIIESSHYPFSGSELPQYSAGESVPLSTKAQWEAIPVESRDRITALRNQMDADRASSDLQQELADKLERIDGDSARYLELRSRGGFDSALRTSLDDQDIRIREVYSKLDMGVRNTWNELRQLEVSAGIQRAYAMREGKVSDALIQISGDPFDTSKRVKRGAPSVLSPEHELKIPDGQSGRLQLAEWITSDANPLTARVAVNYIWKYHFGKGLVATADNFGVSGSSPTHPELLDWLAQEFISSGWSVKHMHRLIMSSAAYQRSSVLNKTQQQQDPENTWLGRFTRYQLDAEAIRDGMLSISGELNLSRPGEHPFPAESSWQFSQHGPFRAVYDSRHRTVFLMTQRIQQHPFLALFDGADTSRTTANRAQSTHALQALYLRNSDFVHQQAQAFADTLLEMDCTDTERLRLAIRTAWSREPAQEELDTAATYIEQYTANWEDEQKSITGLPVSLELEYRFDGSAEDTSGKGLHGKLFGDPTFVDGKKGKCIEFDGDGDFVECPDTLNHLGDRFVVECWVRPGKTQRHYADIFGNHLGGGRGFVVQQSGNETNVFTGSIGIGNENWVLTDKVELPADNWHRIALVRTPTHIQFFRNGELKASAPSNDKVLKTELNFRVGLGITIIERCFNGAIDDLRVYKGIPEEYRGASSETDSRLAAWSSYAKILLTANEFLYVD